MRAKNLFNPKIYVAFYIVRFKFLLHNFFPPKYPYLLYNFVCLYISINIMMEITKIIQTFPKKKETNHKKATQIIYKLDLRPVLIVITNDTINGNCLD